MELTTNISLQKPEISGDEGPTGWPLYINNSFDIIDAQIQALIDDKLELEPQDGQLYARRDGGWVGIDVDENLVGIEECPMDGALYARRGSVPPVWENVVDVVEVKQRDTAEIVIANSAAQTTIFTRTLSNIVLSGDSTKYRVVIGGVFKQDAGAGLNFLVTIKFGATTLWECESQGLTQDANDRAFLLEFNFVKISSVLQKAIGKIMLSPVPGVVSAGAGDFGETANGSSTPIYGSSAENTSGAGTKDLVVSITLDTASASFTFTKHYAMFTEE